MTIKEFKELLQDYINVNAIYDECTDELFDVYDELYDSFDYGIKDFEHNGIKVEKFESGGGEGDGATMYIVFKVNEEYFKVSGYYSSWDSSYYDTWSKVQAVPYTVYRYVPTKED